MDLNYLFLRQQVEHSRAEAARHEAAREAHERLARFYEVEIERISGGRIMFQRREDLVGLDRIDEDALAVAQGFPRPTPK